MEFATLFETMGFPVACVVGLAWYINKIHKETIETQLEWRTEANKTISETRNSNNELMNANRELLETNRTLAETIGQKLDNIENSISKIEIKMEG